MTIDDPRLLSEFRTPGKCEWCGKWCRVREPAHLWAKGMGGGARLDIRINLIALGSTLAFECTCHTDHHAGHRPIREDLLAVVANREKTRQDTIEEAIWSLRRLPNRAPQRLIDAELRSLPEAARKLVVQVLKQKEAA